MTFTGNAAAGQYFIYLMAEDLIPSPPTRQLLNNSPLSSVPVHLSLTGESVPHMQLYKKKNKVQPRSAPVTLQVNTSDSQY